MLYIWNNVWNDIKTIYKYKKYYVIIYSTIRLSGQISSKRHYYLRLCWPKPSLHPWQKKKKDLDFFF